MIGHTRQGRKILRIWGKDRDERDEFVVLAEPPERGPAAQHLSHPAAHHVLHKEGLHGLQWVDGGVV